MKIQTTTNKFKNNRNVLDNKPFLYTDLQRYMLIMEYKKPVTLKKALYDVKNNPNIKGGIVGDKPVVQRFIADLQNCGNILNRKVTKLLGYGSAAAVFETPDGKVVKITDGNHIPMNRPIEFFDVPVFKQGHSGKTYYYLEEKLSQHDMPEYFVDVVKDMIKSKGYRTYDISCWDVHQIGLSAKNGKLYLLDAECARYKTIFHALFSKSKQFLKKIKI